jgi:PAS domain S-box-containing protein
MEAIKDELGGSWRRFLLSLPLDVITFLFLVVVSGSLAWQHLGERWGKSPVLILAVTGPLFAAYYIFLRRIFLDSLAAAAVYFLSLCSLLVLAPVIPVWLSATSFLLLCAAVLLLYDREGHIVVRADDARVRIPMDVVYSNINGVYVQQFLANMVSTFEAYRALSREGKVRDIPAMISAYPRRLLQRQLKERHVEAVISETIRGTELTTKQIDAYIKRDLAAFSKTQREATVYGYEKVNIRKVVEEMEQRHLDVLYHYAPLHYEDLKKICEAEGLEVINLKGLEVLAGLITYTDTEGRRQYAILMRDDPTVHQALKEFALAHELGHWFAHIKGKGPEELEGIEFYLSSLHDLGQFEDEANKVALITLFPTPYLSSCELNKKLNKGSILDDYLRGMRDTERRAPHEQLKNNMLGFIELRIENYHKHKHTWLLKTNLPDTPLPRQVVKLMARYIFDPFFAWAELDAGYIVVDANEKFAELVGLSRRELLQKRIKVTELSEPTSRKITEKQLDEKRKDLSPKFYVTRYNNLRTGEIFPVTIYSLAIVENLDTKEYSGSFGIVTDIRRKTEAAG